MAQLLRCTLLFLLAGWVYSRDAHPHEMAMHTAVAGDPTHFYVSTSKGNDTNDGHSPDAPWSTIARLNTAILKPGDKIFFKRGDTFVGQIVVRQSGAKKRPITLSPYGSGAKPIISGGVSLKGWVPRGPYWSVKAGDTVRDLYANGVQMRLARKPNSGLYTIWGTNRTTNVSCPAVTDPPGYWTGGNIRFRNYLHSWEHRKVESWSGGILTTTSPGAGYSGGFQAGWGFYLDNVLAALDTAGEWYCNPATDSVYFWAPGNVDPNTLAITGNCLDYGVTSSSSYVTIRDLDFRHQCLAAVKFSGKYSNIRVTGCDLSDQLGHGVFFAGIGDTCAVDGNTINHVGNAGIVFHNLSRTTVNNNTIRNVGMVQGYAQTWDSEAVDGWSFSGYTGISIREGTADTVSSNTIDSIGYSGIHPDGHDHVVKNNVITNVLQKMADGGGIYAISKLENDSTTNGTWHHNIIDGAPGNLDGVPPRSWSSAAGIYVDSHTRRLSIKNNTIARIGGIGFLLQVDSRGDTLQDNVFYDCGGTPGHAGGGAYLWMIENTRQVYGGHVITRNTFFPRDAAQQLGYWDTGTGPVRTPGLIDSNYWCNPYGNPLPFAHRRIGSTTRLALSEWRALGLDVHSQGLYRTLAQGSHPDSLFVNRTASTIKFNIGERTYRDLPGNFAPNPLTVPPYSSTLLIYDPDRSSPK